MDSLKEHSSSGNRVLKRERPNCSRGWRVFPCEKKLKLVRFFRTGKDDN